MESVTIDFEDQDATAKKLASWLRSWGWKCIAPEVSTAGAERMRMIALRDKIKIPAATLTEWLKRDDCPEFSAIRGNSGRILEIWVSLKLIEFLRDRREMNNRFGGAT